MVSHALKIDDPRFTTCVIVFLGIDNSFLTTLRTLRIVRIPTPHIAQTLTQIQKMLKKFSKSYANIFELVAALKAT